MISSDSPRPDSGQSRHWTKSDLGRFPRRTTRSTSIKGLILTSSSVLVGVLGLIALGFIADAMAKDPDQYKDLPGIVDVAMAHRRLWSASCMVPLGLGVILCVMQPRPMVARLLAIGGTLWLVAIIVTVFIAFVALLKPIYQYQPI